MQSGHKRFWEGSYQLWGRGEVGFVQESDNTEAQICLWPEPARGVRGVRWDGARERIALTNRAHVTAARVRCAQRRERLTARDPRVSDEDRRARVSGLMWRMGCVKASWAGRRWPRRRWVFSFSFLFSIQISYYNFNSKPTFEFQISNLDAQGKAFGMNARFFYFIWIIYLSTNASKYIFYTHQIYVFNETISIAYFC